MQSSCENGDFFFTLHLFWALSAMSRIFLTQTCSYVTEGIRLSTVSHLVTWLFTLRTKSKYHQTWSASQWKRSSRHYAEIVTVQGVGRAWYCVSLRNNIRNPQRPVLTYDFRHSWQDMTNICSCLTPLDFENLSLNSAKFSEIYSRQGQLRKCLLAELRNTLH